MTTQTVQAPTRTRYIVLLFAIGAYMLIYFDRVLMSAAAPMIQKEFGFTKGTLGWFLGAYQLGYALFSIPGGWFGDRVGPRWALATVIFLGRVFTAIMALTWSVWSAVGVAFLFGSAESGTFPITTRALSRWMLPAERGFAQGATHAGSRLGAAIMPVVVFYLIAHYGWRMPFFIFAAGGLLWTAGWFWFYRDVPAENRFTNEAECTRIEAALGKAPARAKDVPWGAIFSNPRMWLLAAMYSCYAVTLIFFVTWFITYLGDARHLNLKQMGIFASLPFVAATAGDLCGGGISDLILKLTGNINFARRIVAACGFIVCGLSLLAVSFVTDQTLAVACFCVALFALELVVGNAWAVTLDIGGLYAGSISATMNCFGQLASTLFTVVGGYMAVAYGWNSVLYMLVALCFLGALLFSRMEMSRQLLEVKAA